jgi:hypothetical protein
MTSVTQVKVFKSMFYFFSVHQVELFSDREDNSHQALQLTAGNFYSYVVLAMENF